MVCWLVASAAAGCATIKSGEYALPLDAKGRVAAAPVTAAGLLISGKEVSDLSSPYFGLLEVTFENPTAEWVHIDRTRLYAIGGSMGAQETLLLVGRYPHLLAGAVAVDGPADFALQYRNFARYACDAACLLNRAMKS